MLQNNAVKEMIKLVRTSLMAIGRGESGLIFKCANEN